MKVNSFTKRILEYRRFAKRAKRDGYMIGIDIDSLRIDGVRTHVIRDVLISPDGQQVWIKTEAKAA